MTETTELSKLPELPVIEIVDDLVQVYKEFMVIRAALQLGLFDWMAASGPATPEEISAGTGVDTDYISALLGMLFYLDIVRRSDDKYLVSPSANLHFVSTSDYYQGDVIMALASETSPWYDLKGYLTRPEKMKTFEPATVENAAAQAEQEIRGMVRNIATVMSRWAGFKESESLLEIGTGHGLYAIAACQIHPTLSAMVCIQPESAEILQKNISRFGMEGRITPCSGISDSLNRAGQYDMILASHSLYGNQSRLVEIISDIAAHTREGGLFISNHWFIRPTEGTGMQGLYELELGIHNRYHTIQNREEFEEICTDQGLDIFQTGMMRTAYGESTIHMAHKRIGEEK
ncbi:MAG TPA: methyltransferase domain-containing protein [Methanospirillum sp.]|nr:methyltransferase domain-containing protein [Methanospirillum sp.]